MSYPFALAYRLASRAPVHYGQVRVVTPPADDPITLNEALAHLRIEDGEGDNSLITAMIKAATGHVENLTEHALIQRTLRYTLPRFPDHGSLTLAWAPLLALASVKYRDANDDEQTLSPTVYRTRIDSDRRPGAIVLKPGQSWPATATVEDAVSIEYTVGYPTTLLDSFGNPSVSGDDDHGRTRAPAEMKAAIKLILGDLHEHREAQNEAQVYVNAAVSSLLSPFEVPRV